MRIPLAMATVIMIWCFGCVVAPKPTMLVTVFIGMTCVCWLAWKSWRVDHGHFMPSDKIIRRRLYPKIIDGQVAKDDHRGSYRVED